MKKKVACFYRVSTKAQVIDDDIPVQRNACIDFIQKHPDWEFSGEYIEMGVSGFKIHASDREKLEELKSDALSKKFDIILVFMFDRLGRIEEETPFVLKWFVDNGIEMWSVNEGQRKFDNHVDNLLNYITFWQASGESKKTQMRTLEAKTQMIQEGKFLGCQAPYGYKHISTGKHNEKGREIKNLVIDEEQSKVVKQIFDLMTQKGWGSRRIAKLLNDNNTPTKRGGKWAENTILSILKNSIYKGYYTYGRRMVNGKKVYNNQYNCKTSDIKYDDLVIVSEEQWNEVKTIIESRASRKNETHIPKQTKSPLLLTGYIYCGVCGSRMTLHYSYNHHQRKDGTWNRDRKPFYVCYGKENGITKCKNKNYSNLYVEGIVLKQVYDHLDTLEHMNVDKELTLKKESQTKEFSKIIKIKKEKIKNIEEDINLLKNEILNVIRGISKFSQEILSEQIEIKSIELDRERLELEEYTKQVEKATLEREDFVQFKESIPKWRNLLESEDVEVKKMILPKFVDKVTVSKELVDVTLNVRMYELLKLADSNHHFA